LRIRFGKASLRGASHRTSRRAFLWNFQHESGMDPTVVEAVPNVHGTRGRGLYQLTGDRRNAFESRYGGDYSIDNQLDWLMYELSGPERSAWERIQGAGTTGEAAAAIVTNFLRPAAQHRDRRVAEYLGGQAPAYSQAVSAPQGQPQGQPQQNALATLDYAQQGQPQNALMRERFNLDPRDFMVNSQFQFTPVQGVA
jgi:hypothetical protein